MKKFGFLPIIYGIILSIAPCIKGTDFAQRYSLTSHIVNQPSYFDIRQERKKLRKPFRPFPSKNYAEKNSAIKQQKNSQKKAPPKQAKKRRSPTQADREKTKTKSA